MNNQANIREEELKNRIAAAYFGKYDCGRIPGNIDFCMSPKHRDLRQFQRVREENGQGCRFPCLLRH